MRDLGIHAIILTLDEEMHIARCIDSIREHCSSITVIDSGSKDGTEKIARERGADFVVNPFTTHSGQVNFGINYLSSRGGWLFRIDADEIFDADSKSSIANVVMTANDATDGLLVQRRIHFLGRRIRYGSIEPSWQLRLWRNGKGRCEQRWMDEHIKVVGTVEPSDIIISDINLNSLSWWTAKHNSYASREAIDSLNKLHGFLPQDTLSGGASQQAKIKRWIKENLYAKLPSGSRASLYFWYRYFLRLGFLDGEEGFYFHKLQGFWYRTLVDAKIFEIQRKMHESAMPVQDAIRLCTGIDVSKKPEK